MSCDQEPDRSSAKARESLMRDTLQRHAYDYLRDRQRLARTSNGGFKSYGHLLRYAEDRARKDVNRLAQMEADSTMRPEDKVT